MNEQQATQQAMQAGAHPLVLQLAQQMLGKKEYLNYCQQFVEKMGGQTPHTGSAIQSWNAAQNKVQGTQGLQPGDLVYFSPNASNRGFGHTGIYAGNNQFISATDNGIAQNDLGKWQQSTGQQLLGYIPQGQRQAQQSAQMSFQPQQRELPRAPIRLNPIGSPAFQGTQNATGIPNIIGGVY